MREIPEALQSALDSGASTLARCWRLERRDGAVLGFTDHDNSLTFDGVMFEPESGLTPSAIEQVTGLAPDSHQVSGALNSERITAADIALGLYDGAAVVLYLVDWRDADVRTVLSRGQIGEIRRGDTAFEAEIVGQSDRLAQPFGRAFLHSCICRLGDPKCGVDLTNLSFKGSGIVTTVSESQQFSASGLTGFTDAWFSGGQVRWTSGQNAGLSAHVKAHLTTGAETVIELWLSPPRAILEGDAFEITAGCDKTAMTCATKFDNILEFRGFPHMPGDDVAASYPNNGGLHDGGSLFRTQ